MRRWVGFVAIAMFVAGCADSSPSEAKGSPPTSFERADERGLRGTDWRMVGARRVVQKGDDGGTVVSTATAELRGVPFLMFRLSLFKELVIEDLEITFGPSGDWSDLTSHVVGALAPSSTETSLAAVKVHGFKLRSRQLPGGGDCAISAEEARWKPTGRPDGQWVDLRGNVTLRSGGIERAVARARLLAEDRVVEVRDPDGRLLARFAGGQCELASQD